MLADVKYQNEAVKILNHLVQGTWTDPLLLLGPPGVGKRFSVMQALQEMLCQGTRDDKCQCAPCYQLARGLHADVSTLSVSLDKTGINEVRELVKEADSYPSDAPFRCFIIDGVDYLNDKAGDALLKTLEEPPAYARFILLAEDRSRVLPTIASRCGVVRYGLVPDEFILSVVQRYVPDLSKALVYTRMGEGSIGLAFSYGMAGKLTLRNQVLKTMQASANKDFYTAFRLIDAMEDDITTAITFIQQALHDVLIVALDPMKLVNVDVPQTIKDIGEKTSSQSWQECAHKFNRLQGTVRKVKSRELVVDLGFMAKTILAETFV